ncbi:MAG: hypothetical protein FD167_5758, partial [bacterium]
MEETFREKWFPSISDDIEVGTMLGRYARTLSIGGFLIVTTAWGGYNLLFNNYEYSKGTRSGMINKFSEKGLIWKTYEGQMAFEGIV